MDAAIASLLGALIAGGVSGLTLFLSHRREDNRERRGQREKRLDLLSALYEEALFVLDRNARAMSLGTKDDANNAVRILARLRLGAPADIRQQYVVTAEALDSWAEEAQRGSPKPVAGGFVLISSGDTPHQEKAKTLFPVYDAAYEKLQQMMQQHLEALREVA